METTQTTTRSIAEIEAELSAAREAEAQRKRDEQKMQELNSPQHRRNKKMSDTQNNAQNSRPARKLTAKEFTQAVRDYCRRHNCGADFVRTCTSVRREAIEEYEQKHNIIVTGLQKMPYKPAR